MTPKKKRATPKKKTVTPVKEKVNDDDGLSPKTKKKKNKRYVGRTRRHILDRDEGLNGPRQGQQAGEDESPNVVHGAGDNDEPIVEELDSDIDKPYQYESEAFNSPISSDDEGRKPKFHEFDDDTGYGEVDFEIGEMFDTIAQFKQALKDMFVFEGKELEYLKNEKYRVRAKCAEEGCPWLILTSWNSQELCFQVKTYVKEHTCGRNLTSNMVSRSWVTSKLVKRLLTQPQLSPKEALEHMKEDYNVHIHNKIILRALKAAREEVIGNEKEQFGKVRDYLSELHRSNPGSTAIVDVIPQPESPPMFDKLYISLDACKRGFKSGCRPLIGLDGCHLKGYFGGHLLSAVTQDANNHFFVIAYAVVDSECTDTWRWFLTLLQEDLGSCTEYGWNFISDQQKVC
ncbi:uncharacterized protein LOC107606838 [Arachis ipaensis]|uniref:uncharacterized protein LOC107606838 n=1 Tax=Arachis ipaensis TaxID=130454 RepID=UPI0007AF2282|nr:uncharacterized protein LOC107606838 [Arachis ipaensis]